jgi:hypothetical protein
VADIPANEEVLKNLCISLRSSRQDGRLIIFSSRLGHLVAFLTKESDLAPGIIAFLYSRRWEEEEAVRKQGRRRTSKANGTDRPKRSGIPLHLQGEPPAPAVRQALFSQTGIAGALRGPAEAIVVGIPMTQPTPLLDPLQELSHL